MNTTLSLGQDQNLILTEDQIVIDYGKKHKWGMIVSGICFIFVGLLGLIRLLRGGQDDYWIGILQSISGLLWFLIFAMNKGKSFWRKEIQIADIESASVQQQNWTAYEPYYLAIKLKNNKKTVLPIKAAIKSSLEKWLLENKIVGTD